MSDFYALPPRNTPSLQFEAEVVRSLNGLTGVLSIEAGTGIVVTPFENSITIGVQANQYVRIAGDVMTGDLQFTNASSSYGLRLLNASSTPTGDLGAVYFSVPDDTLRLYTSSGWQTLSFSGITQIQGDARYLMLDGSNSPMQGSLSMGSALLQLGLRSSTPSGGVQGQLFFNTTSGQVYVYSSGSWTPISNGGVLAISAGNGLIGSPNPITSTGSMSLDFGYSPTWTGVHTFNQPIVFASSQQFKLTGIYDSGQVDGDIITYNSGWSRVGIGSSGQVLTVASGLPAWQTPPDPEIGTPTDGTYTDGFFNWTSSTLVSDAFDNVNQLFLAIAPAQATSISGLALTETTTPAYVSAILPTGLPSNWYVAGFNAGNTITTYCTGSVFALDSSNPTTAFQIGLHNTQSGWGTLTHNATNSSGTTSSTIDLTTAVQGQSSGSLTLSSLALYNSIWEKANAHIAYTHSSDGYMQHTLVHSAYGTSAARQYWRDTYSASTPSPSFGSGPTAVDNTPVDLWLSGVIYYGVGSTFDITYVAASGIFNRCYHPTHVSQVSGTGMSTVTKNPTSNPAYTDTFAPSTFTVTLNVASAATMNKYLTVTLFKPLTSTSSNATILRPINTYSNASTNTNEFFFDENYRLRAFPSLTLFGSYSSSGSFDTLGAYAQVRNGTLCYPVVSDYQGNPSPYNYTPTFSGARQYERFFYKNSASNGTITWGALLASQISAYGSGDVNVLIYLENDAVWFDLGVAVGTSPGTRNGSTETLALGGRSSASGSITTFSLLTYSTQVSGIGNNGKYRLVVIFNNSNKTITSITTA